MKKYSMILFALMAVAFLAPAAFAQTGAAPGAEGTNWVAITSGFAMAIASAACGLAQARATSWPAKGWLATRARRLLSASRFCLLSC